MGSKTKGSDELFCRSCGEVIKAKAEICPECGVRNDAQRSNHAASTSRRSNSSGSGGGRGSASAPSSSSTRSSVSHDPSNYDTTVSETWYYAVGVGTVGWVVSILLSPVGSDGLLGSVVGLVMLAAWVATPMGLYFDAQYVRANSRWNPNTAAYLVGALVPLVSVVAGGVYLYRRHEVLGEP